MNENVKAIQKMLLHRLAKHNGKHSPEMLRKISLVVNCERVVTNDLMIAGYIIFHLIKDERYEQIAEEQEEEVEGKMEKCIYMVKYGY